MGLINISRVAGGSASVPTPPTGVDTLFNDNGIWYFKDSDGLTQTIAAGIITAVGPTGPTGPEGPIGPTGPQGIQGEQGIQGIEGPIGPEGPMGATGPQGEQGLQGPIGPQGATGPQGEIGPEGPIGATGPQGEQGIQGEIGPEGPIGATGPQGEVGPIGPTGATGPQGIQGEQGPIGPTGPSLPIKSGVVSGSLFTGANVLTTEITFNSAYSDTNYSVSVIGELPRTWSIEDKSTTGFTINSNSSTSFTQSVYWQTIIYGENN
jgi:hypothetical protein